MTKTSRLLAALPLSALAFVAACVPPPEPATPAPTPAPAPAPAPVPQPTPDHANWMDAPATPGDWHYRSVANGTGAFFRASQSDSIVSIQCDFGTRAVALYRSGNASGPVGMQIRTETQERVLTAQPAGQQLPSVVATLSARDPLLDAIAFSKGRFAIETAGMPSLYLPSYPEITRVIEDCR